MGRDGLHGPKNGLDHLEELGVLSQRGKRFEVTWEPIERSGISFADFHDEEQDESWMDETSAEL